MSAIRCIGPSHDGRTNRWAIACLRCQNEFEPPTTLRKSQSVQCQKCALEMVAFYDIEAVSYSYPERDKPHRVQRKRIKGYKMPPNTVSVTRPGKWGNPFKIGSDAIDLPFVVAKRMTGEMGGKLIREQALEAFVIWCERHHDGHVFIEQAKKELRGKNLACFCEIGDLCHADYLLKVVNQ